MPQSKPMMWMNFLLYTNLFIMITAIKMSYSMSKKKMYTLNKKMPNTKMKW